MADNSAGLGLRERMRFVAGWYATLWWWALRTAPTILWLTLTFRWTSRCDTCEVDHGLDYTYGLHLWVALDVYVERVFKRAREVGTSIEALEKFVEPYEQKLDARTEKLRGLIERDEQRSAL